MLLISEFHNNLRRVMMIMVIMEMDSPVFKFGTSVVMVECVVELGNHSFFEKLVGCCLIQALLHYKILGRWHSTA